ncbi:MAG: ABC transporter substrate-binding protein [Vicinamibacterales bacterium]
MKTRLLAFVAALALLAVGPTAAARAQVTRPTIVSLVPALTEMLFAIGAGPQVIGVSSYDDHPPEVAGLPRMGALLDPNTERILAAQPGLVLTYGSQQDLQMQLRRAGIGVFDYRHAGLAGIFRVMRELGKATGHTDEAEQAAADLEKRLAAVRARTARLPKPRTLLVMGREPLTLRNLNASGGIGFLHEVLEIAGGVNVFADVRREAVSVSNEMLLSRAPEAVLDLHYGASEPADRARAQKELAVWQTVSSVPAVRRDRVLPLYGDQFVVPGPRIAEAAEQMARALHPEAFK